MKKTPQEKAIRAELRELKKSRNGELCALRISVAGWRKQIANIERAIALEIKQVTAGAERLNRRIAILEGRLN